MENIKSDLDTLIQNKLDADSDFQASLVELSDEDKEQTIAQKKSELIKAEFIVREDARIKAEEIANNQKIRAEKAEQELKTAKKVGEQTPKNEDLSIKDLRALNTVHDDDVDFVVNWAKANKIEVAEAIKNKDVQFILKGHEEERKSAEATNTTGGRKTVSKTTGEALLEKAMSGGELPEEDEDIKKMIEARFTPKT